MRPIHIEKFKIWEEDINQQNYFNKLTDARQLFEVFPHLQDFEELEATVRDVPAYARGNIIGRDGTLMRHFEKNARTVSTTANRVRWKLYVADGDIRATIIENVDPNNTQPGFWGGTFPIKLDTPWFGPNDTLIVENFRELPLLITSEPQASGMGFIYEVKVIGENDKYFPPELLTEGRRVMQAGSFTGEAQVERGNIHFGMGKAFLEFEVPMTEMGFQMKITDKAHLAAKNFRIAAFDQQNRPVQDTPDLLVSSLDVYFMDKVNEMKDLWLTYGRAAGKFSGKYLDQLTQRQLSIGPGLFEFLESSYIYDYPIENGNLEMFIDFLTAAWHDKVDPSQRNVQIYTGTGGLKLWAKWCREADNYGIIQMSEDFYSDEEALFQGRKGVGINVKQYRSVFVEPFGKITVNYMAMLDSDLVESRKYKNLPITSYEFLVWDYGYGEGPDANIHILRNEEVEQFGYGVGTWSPMGPVLNNANASRYTNTLGKEKAFEIIHDFSIGILAKDTSYMLWFRPALV